MFLSIKKYGVAYWDALESLEDGKLHVCSKIERQAAALAKYARITGQGELENSARRIRAYAIYRGGVLLGSIQCREGVKKKDVIAVAAKDAGISARIARKMLIMARAPEKQFRSMMDGGHKLARLKDLVKMVHDGLWTQAG